MKKLPLSEAFRKSLESTMQDFSKSVKKEMEISGVDEVEVAFCFSSNGAILANVEVKKTLNAKFSLGTLGTLAEL